MIFMFSPSGVADELERFDIASASAVELRRALGHAASLRSWLEACETRMLNQLQRLTDDAAGQFADVTGVSSKQARARFKRAGALSQLPATLDALTTGAITPEHADTMVAAVANNPAVAPDIRSNEASLLDDCGTVDQLTTRLREFVTANDGDPNAKAMRQRQRRKGSFWVGEDDMECSRFDLPPVEGAEVKQAIVDEAKRLWRQQNNANHDPGDSYVERHHAHYLADALVSLIRKATGRAESGATGSSGGGRQTGFGGIGVVAVHAVGAITDTLEARGVDTRLADGTPLPVETLRRLACMHGIMPGLVDDFGAMLYLGRRVRLATPAQRLVLQTMYPGCSLCGTDWSWCDVHHIEPWELGGLTDLDNLAPLCDARCHPLVHEGGWTITSPRLGVIEIYAPDGHLQKRVLAQSHAPPRAA